MGIIRKELDIVDVFRKDPLKEFSFKEIMISAKKRSVNWSYNTLKKFVNLKLIIPKKVNNSYLYKVNLNNSLLLSYFHTLDFADAYIKNTAWSKEIYTLLEGVRVEVAKVTPFFILLVFGSYASKRFRKDSDLDLVFIVESKEVWKEIEPYIDKVVKREILKIHYHIITKNDFVEMLLRKEENLGKEIFKKHIILWGFDQYYELIKEAGENGFIS